MMKMESPVNPLKGKRVLAVDDEPDVIETLQEALSMCEVAGKASYEDARVYLEDHRPDLVILDIMGVNGFELLKICVEKKIPTVMLTAHAFSLDSLKKSIELGASAYFPKERIASLVPFLEEMLTLTRKESWQQLSEKLGEFFNATLGSDWKKHMIVLDPLILKR
jgi:DNA-binding response OmpR family regulator